MKRQRRNHTPRFKAEVAIDALRERETIAELTSRHQVHSTVIGVWKKTLLERSQELFENPRGRKNKEQEELTDRLYRQIGQLQVELDWLKKKLG